MRLAPALIFLAICSCSEPKATPADTGAKEVASQFFVAACGPDPSGAYAMLDAASQKKVTAERFVELAKRYAKNLGFAVEKVHVHAFDEHGDDATAHLALTGGGKRFSDGITLRKGYGKWLVVLPANFGHTTAK